MMMRLDPPIPLTTPLGDASAHFVIDDGREEPLRWVTFVHASGECWTFRNQEVRLWTNMTEGRDRITPFPAETLARFAGVAGATADARLRAKAEGLVAPTPNPDAVRYNEQTFGTVGAGPRHATTPALHGGGGPMEAVVAGAVNFMVGGA